MPVVDIQKKVPPLLRRRNVLQLLIITLLAEIGYGVLNISNMPVYIEKDRGLGGSVIGLVFAAFMLSEALFKSTMGHLADRYGRRRMMVIGPAITACTALLTLAIPPSWQYMATFSLIFLRVLDGIGAAMLWPAAYALIGDIVEPHEREEGLSLLNMCFMLGVALALPVGGLVNVKLGPMFVEWGSIHSAASFYLTTAVFISVALMAYRMVPSGRAFRDVQKQESSGEDGTDIKKLLDAFKSIPNYMVLGFVTFIGVGFPIPIFKNFFMNQFSMTEAQFGMLVLPGALVMAAFSVPIGKLGPRIGNTKAVHLGMALCTLGLGAIASGALSKTLQSPWVVAVGAIPLGIGFLLTIPAWYASVSAIDAGRRGAFIGAVMTSQGLGAIIGVLAGGASYDHLQAYGASFGHYSPFVGSFLCVGIGLFLGLKILKEQPKSSN